MVAIVQIHEKNGVGETATDKTSGNIRLKNADSAAVDAANPIPVPQAGSNFSFEKWLRLSCTLAPDTQIENLQAYTDGANGMGTGVSVHYKTEGTYAQPAQPADATGFSDLFTATSGSPIDMDATNTGPFTTTGDMGDYLVLLMEVASTATQGATPTETITFSYDES